MPQYIFYLINSTLLILNLILTDKFEKKNVKITRKKQIRDAHIFKGNFGLS